MTQFSILDFGFGNMTGAMVDGWLAAGMPPAAITVYNPRSKPVPDGVALLTEMPTRRFDAVVLGVKPQMLGDIAAQLEPLLGPETVLI